MCVLEFELRASCLLGSVLSIIEIGSHELFAWAGLKPRSSWFQLLDS
jgi:hypothetical protein